MARLNLLDRVDYTDAFSASVPPDVLSRCTSEPLTELVMGRAPRWLMHVLVPALHRRVLRLRLAPATPASGPRGWRQLDRSPEAVVFGARSAVADGAPSGP